MNILGVHIGHDSGSALVVDGRVVADVSEERFVRIKHYADLPVNSIDYCLRQANITIDEVDCVAIPTNAAVPELNELFKIVDGRKEKRLTKSAFHFARKMLGVGVPKLPLYFKTFELAGKTEIIHVEHHLAHAASAYYTSGFSKDDKCLVVTCDGLGDGYSFCIWKAQNNKIEPILKLKQDASIGWFYSTVTEALGWWHGDGEGKTMGLAPYGDWKKAKGALDGFYPKFEDGNLIKGHDFGVPYFWKAKGSYQFHFDQAYEIQKIINEYGRENIAAEAQRVLEEQIKNMILPCMKKERVENLVCAGGIFLNVKLNQRIWNTGLVKKHHIYPNPGDAGLAVGAALETYYRFNPSEPLYSLKDIYWGPEFTDNEIEAILKARNIPFTYLDNPTEISAKLLAENSILAWFQGRMESGPRALGNRSILMNTAESKNKDIINAKVKFREAFRPFCPSMLFEVKDDYLENVRPEYFMITSFDVKEDKKALIPTVVHVDGTARPQMVRKEDNPRYWDLIKAFGDITGSPVLLNTSLNVAGEPIVCHPRDALRCFFDNGLDHLVMGNYLVSKKNL